MSKPKRRRTRPQKRKTSDKPVLPFVRKIHKGWQIVDWSVPRNR